MAGIVFDSFDFGLDLRRGASTSPPNRLRDLVNCYITTGKEIKKRPGLELVATLEAGTKGLKSGLGKLNTFYESGTVTHANTLFKPNKAAHPTPGLTTVSKIWYCDAFNGYLYLAVEYANGDVKHHYLSDPGAWAAATKYVLGNTVRPATPNGLKYEVTGTYNFGAATMTIAAPCVVTRTAHNLVAGDKVYFTTTGALPTGLTANTHYYVLNPVANNTFNVEATLGGGAITTTGSQSGVHTLFAANPTSNAAAPTWPTTVGNTVVENIGTKNEITWTARSTAISDSNCPHGKGVTKSASKIWGTKAASPYDVVRYSKTDDCTNWTAAGDAGFLPVGLKQENAQDCRALGQFQNKLVCFFQDSAQLWTVDTNPANNALSQRIFGVGTRYPQSPASFADDVFFLADQGVRSITVNQMTANLQDSDIGSPIDSVVIDAISGTPLGIYIPPFGQFWLMMGSIAWVYTFSKNAKLAAWAKYTFPFTIDDIAILDNIVYVRNNDKVYKFSEDKGTDDGSPIQCRVQFPYLDFKKPGILKQITAMDAVLEGSWAIQFLIDGNDQGASTDPFIVTGDTRPLPSIPVELCVPAIAPVLQHSGNEAAKLSALSFTFYDLGTM